METGASPERAPAAGSGGGAGANYLGTAWDVVCGQAASVSDLAEFLNEVKDSPELRAGATLRTLSRLRSELERMPEDAGLDDPVVIKLRDAVLLMSQMLARLR